jgi:uncharacterized protein YceH (UPF0502 family)
MPDVLTHVWPMPPANDAPLAEGGDQHSQAWTRYFQAVSDEFGSTAMAFVAMRPERQSIEDALNARVAALEARVAALEGP